MSKKTSYTKHITNGEDRSNVTQHADNYEDLETSVKKRKLKWYENITCMLSKTNIRGDKTELTDEEMSRQRRCMDQ